MRGVNRMAGRKAPKIDPNGLPKKTQRMLNQSMRKNRKLLEKLAEM